MKLYKTIFLLFALIAGVSASWADPVTLAEWSSETTTTYTNDGYGYYTPTLNGGSRADLQSEFSSRIYFYPSSWQGTQSNYKLTFCSSNTSARCGFYSNSSDAFWSQIGSSNNITDYTVESNHDNYMEVSFPATGYKSIQFHTEVSGFSSSQGTFVIVISPDGGTTWLVGGEYQSGTTWSNFVEFNETLAVINCSSVKVRIIAGNGTSNDWYFKNISISGETATEEDIANIRTLTVTQNYDLAGFVKITPLGNTFTSGTNVTLEASSNAHFSLIKWTDGNGSELGTSAILNQTMTTNLTINALYGYDINMPISPDVLDLSNGKFGSTTGGQKPAYESGSSNLGWIENGGYAIYNVYNANEPAYYNFSINIFWYQKNGTIMLTVTDVATNTPEASVTSPTISEDGNVILEITNPIMPGLKQLRLDFASSESGYIFNVNNVTFSKRAVSLNENYDFTAVAESDVNVVLVRTIPANKWSTIVLPFDMTNEQLKAAFGNDVSVAELTSGDATLLTFSAVTAIEANKPYAIKVTSDFSSATIEDVTIVEGTPTQTITNWDFVGTYASGTIPTGSYFFSGNQLWQASDETNTIKPFRAYFTYTGNASAPQPRFIISSENNATNTDVIEAKEEVVKFFRDGQLYIKRAGATYDVLGRIIR
ncbi:MAG: hypothetical protein IJS49_03735 [Paludibacteraceae bacterium]|nr:hypothetical protein [Paludibacteraceae bacterium]